MSIEHLSVCSLKRTGRCSMTVILALHVFLFCSKSSICPYSKFDCITKTPNPEKQRRANTKKPQEPKKSWRQDNRRRRNSSEREVLVKKVEENRENVKKEYRNRRRQRYNRGHQRNDDNRRAETEKTERDIKRMIGMLK